VNESPEDFLAQIKRESDARASARRLRFAKERPWSERHDAMRDFVREDLDFADEIGEIRSVFVADEDVDASDHVVAVSAVDSTGEKFAALYRTTDDTLRSTRTDDAERVSMSNCVEASDSVFVWGIEQARVIVRALREAFGEDVLR